MATRKEEEKKTIEKKASSFTLIGQAKINDYTYKIDEKSEKSDWVYNSLNLGVYCGEKYGTVYAELMGGYGAERDNVIYVHGKDSDGKDDFANSFQIDWDDRFDETVLETVGDLCFMTVGLEKDKTGKTFYKKFLTAYDLIKYVKENLTDNTIVNVKGNIRYSMYNNVTQAKKEINSIVLSKVDDVSKFAAKFTQTMLLTKDSWGEIDKNTGIVQIHAFVPDYLKELNGKTIKANVPYPKTFEYEIDLTNKELAQKIKEKLFKVSKDVTEITFEGDLIEGGAVVTATEDDIPDDIKTLVEIGVYTMEEALAKCTVSSGRERRMVIRKPSIKIVEDKTTGDKTPVLQKFERKYKEDDIAFSFAKKEEEESDVTDDDANLLADDSTSDDDNSWLDEL